MRQTSAGALLRLAASIALIGLLVWWARPGDVVEHFRNASIAGLLAVIALHLADRVLMAYKWWRLLRARGHAVQFKDAVRSYFLASFVGAVIPVAGGADATRFAAMRGKGAASDGLLSSIALERALGAISHGLFCLGSVALAVAMRVDLQVSNTTLALAAVATVTLLSLCLPVSFLVARQLGERWATAPGLRQRIAALSTDYAGWRQHPRELWVFLTLTFLEGLYPILGYYTAARALGVETSLLGMAIVVPIAFLIPRLPIPLPSLGPEQGTFVLLATRVGMTPGAATATTFLFLGTLLLALAPGAIAWLNRPPAPSDAG